MSATAQSLDDAAVSARPMAAIVADLIKLRLTILVILTSMVGFYLGSQGVVDLLLMLHAVLGTGILASGAAALNQYLERDYDAKMARTESRPLPAGELTPASVLAMGAAMSAVGLLYLALLVSSLTALLGAVTLASYIFIYTPLKRRTPANTIIGAIPGALPPLMGWTAAAGSISIGGWSLFAILFFWQLPHFLAISWIYRDQYQRAGFQMLSCLDPTGQRVGGQAVSHTLGLLPISLSPFVFGLTGPMYCLGALVLGLVFLRSAWRFSRELTRERARGLFLFSILYLPALLILMVLDKAPTG